jgi:predicted enzyme related to lactoylglutathione lyase
MGASRAPSNWRMQQLAVAGGVCSVLTMAIRYSHTNIVAQDPESLAAFYTQVFECRQAAVRRLAGEWLARGMGLPGARLHVIHLALPGLGADGPTLEIFRMDDIGSSEPGAPTRPGLMHMAFAVDDIHATLQRLLGAGGETLGEIAEADIDGVGPVAFVYARDPEGNIVELQEFRSPQPGAPAP